MARTRPTLPVKLVCCLSGGDIDLLRRAKQLLVRKYGSTDAESAVFPMMERSETLGENARRIYVSFENLIPAGDLATIKLECAKVEFEILDACLGSEVAEPVRIDPGYVELNKVVMATTSDQPHRIFVGLRVFAEAVLAHAEGRWETWPWTDADFASADQQVFFERARGLLERARRRVSELDGSAGSE